MKDELLVKINKENGSSLLESELLKKAETELIRVNSLFSFRIVNNMMYVNVDEIALMSVISSFVINDNLIDCVNGYISERIEELVTVFNELPLQSLIILSSIINRYASAFENNGFNINNYSDEELNTLFAGKQDIEKYRNSAVMSKVITPSKNESYELK